MAVPLIPLIMGLVSAQQQAAGAREDAAVLRQEGNTAFSQSVQDADAVARETRQLLGKQAAGIAENGGGYGGTNAKLLSQSETLANLDRLKILYEGSMRRSGLRSQARTTLARGYMGAATSLLNGASGMFGGAAGGGSKIPSY
jgi:hypothetical protein